MNTLDRLLSTLGIMRAEIKSLEARSLKEITAGHHDISDGLDRCSQALTLDADRLWDEVKRMRKAIAQSQPLMDKQSQPSGVRHRVGCTRLGASLSHYTNRGPTCEYCGVTG